MWRLSIHTTAEAEEAVSELLQREFAQPVTSMIQAETLKTQVSVFIARRSEITPARLVALRLGLRQLRACGLSPGAGRITVSRLRRIDWAESWKRHFKPLEIGRALLIKPSWSQRKPRKGEPLLVLDPGLSFGTGQHPTTRFCLEQLVFQRDPSREQSFLDLGTGSGILALAAAKLGYAPIVALDADPDAVRIARANAKRNGVSPNLDIACQDLSHLPRKSAPQYDLVCANLVSDLLILERARIVPRVTRGGLLVLAGILRAQFRDVRAAYEAAGLKLVAQKRESEWKSGTFKSM